MQTITANYVRHDEDWTVTVSGLGKTLNGEASGIIAARDRADQLVAQLAGEDATPTVVHLLNGSAYEFTSTYMTARLTRGSQAPEETADDDQPAEDQDVAQEGDEGDDKSAAPAVPHKELSQEPQNVEHRYARAG